MRSIGLLACAFFLFPIAASRTIRVRNRCPGTVPLYRNGASEGSLDQGERMSLEVEDTWEGFLYTSANGGSQSGQGSVKVGFYGQANYYYIVKDSATLNVGASVVPNGGGECGCSESCEEIRCNSIKCSTARIYSTVPSTFPSPTEQAPLAPLFGCQSDSFAVTFCPERTFPPGGTYFTLHPALAASSKCVDIRDADLRNGTRVQIYDCNGTAAQRWTLNGGKIQLAGTNFCLNAGEDPTSGTRVTIRSCSVDSPTWTTDSSGKLHLDGTNQCLDLTKGSLRNRTPLQTWTCQDEEASDYQQWTRTTPA